MNTTLRFMALSLLLPASASAQDHLGWMWAADDFPLQWESSTYEEDSLPPGYPQQMHQGAFDEWNRTAVCGGMSSEVIGNTESNTPFTYDFQNRLTYDDPGDELSPGILAATVSLPQGVGAVVAVKNGRAYTRLFDSDIVYNDNVFWSTEQEAIEGSCDGDAVMWNTAVHEIGHAYGLKHTCEENDVCTDPQRIEATMMWTNTGPSCALDRGIPNELDVQNITSLYGPFASFSCSHELTPGASDTIALGIVDSEEGFTLRCLTKSDELENITNATWYFGDGGVSNDINGTHTYEEPGNYTLRVCFDIEQESCGVTQYCFNRNGYVRACATPEPVFEIRHEDGLTYNLRNETDLSVYGCIYEIQWDIFDSAGTLVSSINSWEPEFTFPEVGDYRVVLNIGGPGGTGAAELNISAKNQRASTFGSCSSTGTSGSLGGLAFLGLLALRRRRSS